MPSREPTPCDPARNPRRRPACPPFPDDAHALPAHPPLQHLPQHQRLQDRQRGPDVRLERGVLGPRGQEEADFRQQVWRERAGARRYGWVVSCEYCGWWFGIRFWQEGEGRYLSQICGLWDIRPSAGTTTRLAEGLCVIYGLGILEQGDTTVADVVSAT